MIFNPVIQSGGGGEFSEVHSGQPYSLETGATYLIFPIVSGNDYTNVTVPAIVYTFDLSDELIRLNTVVWNSSYDEFSLNVAQIMPNTNILETLDADLIYIKKIR